jgi:hypothetical protein
MAKDQKLTEELAAAAKQGMEQAAEQYFGWMQKSMPAAPWLDAELSKKMMGFAHENMAASWGFVQRLTQAKDFQDLLRIQTEFMQTQLESFGKQAKDISEASSKMAAGAFKSPSDK